jgi:general L-amino acid transport system substrate-binding protein
MSRLRDIALAGLAGAALLALSACKDPGSAVDEPPPTAAALKGAPDPALAEASKQQGQTLRAVKARGLMNCGVATGQLGFAYTDDRGTWRGFDIDFCRAVAAATLGDPNRVRLVPLDSKARFTALQSGEIDVLSRNTSWTFTRNVGNRLAFVGIYYYDGQGFMVRKALGLSSANQLNGARVCLQSGTTTELNVSDFFRMHGLRYTPVVVDSEDQARQNYAREACDAYTGDVSELAAMRSIMDRPSDHVILPEVISKEPLGPSVREGDSQWEDVVRWTLYSLILAEELGVTSKNVDQMRASSTNPEVRRLLGVEGGYGRMLGLSDDWAYKMIKAVGNYGEIFDRNLRKDSALKLPRGVNAQWNANPPGLIYAPPMR